MKVDWCPKVGVLFAMVGLLAFQLSSCKDEISAEEAFLNKVSGTWKASPIGVSVDGVAVNGAFSNFSITIKNDATYTTTNGNSPIWPSSGKITVVANSSSVGFKFMRSDGVEVAIQQFTDTKLVLALQYADPNGRTRGVSGNYVFDLQKN
ncbi:MAG TPA: hypothetical protein VIS49_14195 [Cyclobacteriaceae bacterium]